MTKFLKAACISGAAAIALSVVAVNAIGTAIDKKAQATPAGIVLIEKPVEKYKAPEPCIITLTTEDGIAWNGDFTFGVIEGIRLSFLAPSSFSCLVGSKAEMEAKSGYENNYKTAEFVLTYDDGSIVSKTADSEGALCSVTVDPTEKEPVYAAYHFTMYKGAAADSGIAEEAVVILRKKGA